MADQYIQVPPNSTGLKVDTSELTVNAQTVERQRIVIGDSTSATSLATVGPIPVDGESGDIVLSTEGYGMVFNGVAWDRQRGDATNGTIVQIKGGGNTVGVTSLGGLQVQGVSGATTFSAVTATGTLASTVCGLYNVVTLTLRTFTGTTPSITFKLQASDDNTNWVDIQGINNQSGVVATSWTQASALAAGTAGLSIDYTIGAYTNVRINVTAISGTSPSAAFGLSFQTMPYEASPGALCQGLVATGSAVIGNPVLIGGSDGTNARAIATTVKGTQGAYGVTTQDLKDAGRTQVTLYADSLSGITTEALTSCNIVKGTATQTAATSYTVTAGKTLRIQSLSVSVTSPSTTACSSRVRLRTAASGIAASSPILVHAAVGAPGVTLQSGFLVIPIPDGLEVAGGTQIAISHIDSSTFAGSTTTGAGLSFCLNGYEY